MKGLLLILLGTILPTFPVFAQSAFDQDTLDTDQGPVVISFICHGTLMIQWNNKTIHIDPYSRCADYAQLPKADLVLITHHHGDHLDKQALAAVTQNDPPILLTETAAEQLGKGSIMKNGAEKSLMGLSIKAVPAYNIEHKRSNGEPYHPKGVGNGYVVGLGDFKIYIAGDTENIPEMKALQDIDVAFLPMNLPYTMTPQMAANAAGMIQPKILYPYHYGDTDPHRLVEMLQDAKDIEVRIRQMQ